MSVFENSVLVEYENDAGNSKIIKTNPTLSPLNRDEWFHVSFSFNGDGIKMLLNETTHFEDESGSQYHQVRNYSSQEMMNIDK